MRVQLRLARSPRETLGDPGSCVVSPYPEAHGIRAGDLRVSWSPRGSGGAGWPMFAGVKPGSVGAGSAQSENLEWNPGSLYHGDQAPGSQSRGTSSYAESTSTHQSTRTGATSSRRVGAKRKPPCPTLVAEAARCLSEAATESVSHTEREDLLGARRRSCSSPRCRAR